MPITRNWSTITIFHSAFELVRYILTAVSVSVLNEFEIDKSYANRAYN